MNAIVAIDTPEIARSPAGQPIALDGARMADFLECLQTMGNVSVACERAGIARQTAYRARRRHAGFARAWDAAVVAARHVAEVELADKAVHGWEEQVFYHGEEVARRRRFSDRLLLAHLARLDRMAERLDVAASLPLLDGWIAALRDGGGDGADGVSEGANAVDAVLPASASPEELRRAQDEREMLADPRAAMAAAEAREAALTCSPAQAGASVGGEPSRETPACAEDRTGKAGAQLSRQDAVTPVTPCRDCWEPMTARGFCGNAQCPGFDERFEDMMEARPADAPALEEAFPDLGEQARVEILQLEAFEAGVEKWWLLMDAPGLAKALASADRGDAAGDGEAGVKTA